MPKVGSFPNSGCRSKSVFALLLRKRPQNGKSNFPLMQPNPVPDFNFIAPVYDALAQLVYGKAQRRAQAHFLSMIPAGSSVLILGGGSGWILPELLRQSRPARVLFLEPSAQMMQRAKRRFPQLSARAEVE